MIRPVHLDYPDTFYHALSWANERSDIFLGKAAYIKFLDLLTDMTARFKVQIHSYVLMRNLYYVLI